MLNSVNYIINKKETKIIKLWLLMVTFILIVIVSISLFYEYKIFSTYQGIIKNINDNYYLTMYLTDDDLIKFNQKKMYINKKQVSKKIIDIREDYEITELGKFRLIILDTEIKNKDKINNNIIEVQIYERKTTIMKEIKKIVMEE